MEVQGDVFAGVEPHGLFPLETGRVCVRAGVSDEVVVNLLTNGLQDLSFRLSQLFLPDLSLSGCEVGSQVPADAR